MTSSAFAGYSVRRALYHGNVVEAFAGHRAWSTVDLSTRWIAGTRRDSTSAVPELGVKAIAPSQRSAALAEAQLVLAGSSLVRPRWRNSGSSTRGTARSARPRASRGSADRLGAALGRSCRRHGRFVNLPEPGTAGGERRFHRTDHENRGLSPRHRHGRPSSRPPGGHERLLGRPGSCPGLIPKGQVQPIRLL